MSDNCRVVALDMRGCGDSDKPEGKEHYKWARLVDDIKDCIKALGRDKCTLVGADTGGVVVYCLATLEPRLVESYVIMSSAHPVAFRNILEGLTIKQIMSSWYIFLMQMPFIAEIYLKSDDFLAFEKAFKSIYNFYPMVETSTCSISEEEIEAFKYTLRKSGTVTSVINIYRANFMPDNFLTRLMKQNIDFPAGLILFGEKDLFLIKETQEESMKLISNATLVFIKNASHFLHQSHSKEIIQEMKLFFKRLPKKVDINSSRG